MSEQNTRRTFAPRLLVIAVPAGVWVTVTRAAEHPVDESAIYGGVVFGLVLFGPALFRGASKAAAASRARKAATAKKADQKGTSK